MSSRARILIKGSGLRSVNFFVNLFTSFLLMPFIIYSLGDRMYGFWILLGSFNGFYQLFDFGMDAATQRYVSRALGNKDYKEANIAINTSLMIYVIIGISVFLLALLISFLLPFFIRNVNEIALLQKVVILLGLEIAIGFPNRAFSGVLSAHLRFDLKSLIEIIRVAVRTALIVIFLKKGYGIMSLAFISLGTSLGYYFLINLFAQRLATYMRLSIRLVDKKRIKEIFSYSSYIFIAELANRFKFDLDNFVIAGFVGVSSITVYSIASRLVKYFASLINTSLGITMPLFSQYEAKGDYRAIREKFILLTKISCYMSIFIGGCLIMFGKAFIARWVTDRYIYAFNILLVLIVPSIISSMQVPSIQLLQGISKHRFYAISNLMEGVANLVLSLILVKKFGIFGVAMGTAIPMVITKLFVQPIYTCKFIGLKVNKYYTEILLPIAIKCFFIFYFSWLIFRGFVAPNYLLLGGLALTQLIFFLIFIVFFGFNRTERSYLSKVVFLRY